MNNDEDNSERFPPIEGEERSEGVSIKTFFSSSPNKTSPNPSIPQLSHLFYYPLREGSPKAGGLPSLSPKDDLDLSSNKPPLLLKSKNTNAE
ncbi:MAG: hypothetical protein LBO09_05320 [Candidatus Peribacteria bacterium]|jgi:hypothetical protein|nr:hypothetical protein [Candidatus Peribacteria bacterium]